MMPGGSEKVLSLLANEWAARGDRVTLLAMAEEHPSHFPLHPSVCYRCLGFAAGASTRPGRFATFVQRILSLRRSLRASKPDVIVAFTCRVDTLTILSSLGMRVPVIVSERVDPIAWRDIQPWQFMRTITLPLASAVVSQTQAVADHMRRLVGKRSVAIANPVPAVEPCQAARKGNRLVGCGRLTEAKRFDRLIEAFHLLHQRYPQWSLTIGGEGVSRPELEKLIAQRGLGGRVYLPGAYHDPRELLADADIFVLSSEYEGFPNALAEAMACGVPVVSFNCRSGPAEMIRDGVDGLLVPLGNVPALAGAMEKLMREQSLRLTMGKNATEVSSRFSLSLILSKWDRLFEKLGVPVRTDLTTASIPESGVGNRSI
jgi:glycosyltransferase involved in cell wall biosynthesis